MKTLTTLLLAVTLAACRTTAPDPGTRLDALFTDLHRRGMFDGAVVVGDTRGVLWQKGFGYANAERQVPFAPDTPADGASLAKTFTAALLVTLAGEGRVDLDASAQRLLPELPYPAITLRHLLSHSSGIPVLDYDYFDRFLSPDRVRTTEVLLGVIAEQKPPLAFEPGSAFEYSSFGYDLAALAAARAAGKPFSELLRERVFVPLGIRSAFVRPGRLSEFPGLRTLGYRHVDSKLEVNDVFDLEAFHGGSNIYISASDLHRWNASFFSKPALAFALINGQPSGLTLNNWYRDDTRFWYSGHLAGFHSEVFRDMRLQRSIVFMSNNTLDAWLQKAIVPAVNAILDGRDPGPLVRPPTDVLAKEQRASLVGAWRLPEGERLAIDISDRGTRITRHGVSYRMVQVDPRTFYVPGLDFMVGFVKDTMVLWSNLGEQRASRLETPSGY